MYSSIFKKESNKNSDEVYAGFDDYSLFLSLINQYPRLLDSGVALGSLLAPTLTVPGLLSPKTNASLFYFLLFYCKQSDINTKALNHLIKINPSLVSVSTSSAPTPPIITLFNCISYNNETEKFSRIFNFLVDAGALDSQEFKNVAKNRDSSNDLLFRLVFTFVTPKHLMSSKTATLLNDLVDIVVKKCSRDHLIWVKDDLAADLQLNREVSWRRERYGQFIKQFRIFEKLSATIDSLEIDKALPPQSTFSSSPPKI